MYLEFHDITKTYPGVNALLGVSFGVREGTVHALLGENGAGKSTLLKVLSGAHRPSSGHLSIAGRNHVFHSTSDALAAGVAVIYQELHLIPEMTVAENIYLGHLPGRAGVVNRAKLRADAAAQLRRLGEDIDPETKLARLPIGQRQMVEIAKALTRGAQVIAFDEPTSSLSAREIDRLFAVIQDLRRQGCAILYVTHRMEEIFRLGDACTVLRDGRQVRTYASLDGVSAEQLVKDMVGRDIADVFGYRVRPQMGPALEVENLVGRGLTAPVSFSVQRGEILGLFGLIGAGRTELLKLLFGAEKPESGTIRVHGAAIAVRQPRDAIRAGLVYCTEDRKKEGIVSVRSAMENCNLSARRHHLRWASIIDERWERQNAQQQMEAMRVKTPSLHQLIKHLSGGNQQKVILGRWLSEAVNVLMLDEPTRGIDVGAKSEIYQIMYRVAEEGRGVVMVSSDLPEVLGVSDRVAVMRHGRLSALFSRSEATPERVLAAALPREAGQAA